MSPVGASIGCALLAGGAIALVAADHPRLATAALAFAVLLLVLSVAQYAARARSPRP